MKLTKVGGRLERMPCRQIANDLTRLWFMGLLYAVSAYGTDIDLV